MFLYEEFKWFSSRIEDVREIMKYAEIMFLSRYEALSLEDKEQDLPWMGEWRVHPE